MKPTFPRIGSFGTTQANAGGAASNDPANLGSASQVNTAEAAHATRRSLKARLLSCLGIQPSAAVDVRSNVTNARFSHASPAARTGSARVGAIPAPLAAQTPRHTLRRGNRDTKMLAHSIRSQLAELPVVSSERFERQLGNFLLRKDAKGRIALLMMLEKNVNNELQKLSHSPQSSQRLSAGTQPASLPPARQRPVQLVSVRYAGVEATLPKSQEQQILAIRVQLLRLPATLSSGYQLLLRDVITSENPVKRTQLLNQMSRQIDEHLGH